MSSKSTGQRPHQWRGGVCQRDEDVHLSPVKSNGVQSSRSHEHPQPEGDHFQEYQGCCHSAREVSSEIHLFLGFS